MERVEKYSRFERDFSSWRTFLAMKSIKDSLEDYETVKLPSSCSGSLFQTSFKAVYKTIATYSPALKNVDDLWQDLRKKENPLDEKSFVLMNCLIFQEIKGESSRTFMHNGSPNCVFNPLIDDETFLTVEEKDEGIVNFVLTTYGFGSHTFLKEEDKPYPVPFSLSDFEREIMELNGRIHFLFEEVNPLMIILGKDFDRIKNLSELYSILEEVIIERP
ncbi:MAG: hypothetical protein GOU97_03505 [Nanoarchaeota archaeon]|nr:hypothetical protein [Nanoarchaeota archaeon]